MYDWVEFGVLMPRDLRQTASLCTYGGICALVPKARRSWRSQRCMREHSTCNARGCPNHTRFNKPRHHMEAHRQLHGSHRIERTKKKICTTAHSREPAQLARNLCICSFSFWTPGCVMSNARWTRRPSLGKGWMRASSWGVDLI